MEQKRRVSHKGARNKGRRGETEFVDICRELGLPAQRVLASGSFIGAKADVKVGVYRNPDGTYPAEDESRCIFRVEVKHRADNPESLHTELEDPFVIALLDSGKGGPERLWDYLNQDAISKAVVLRRAKVPTGAVKDKRYNEMGMVCMGYADWVALVLKAYGSELVVPDQPDVPRLKKQRRFVTKKQPAQAVTPDVPTEQPKRRSRTS